MPLKEINHLDHLLTARPDRDQAQPRANELADARHVRLGRLGKIVEVARVPGGDLPAWQFFVNWLTAFEHCHGRGGGTRDRFR